MTGVLIFMLSCHDEDMNVSNPKKILALGHGGMGAGNLYPMNSYESIRKCLEMKADGVEIDIQMTQDSVLVAFHDHDLSESTTLIGLIHDLTWKEIENGRYTTSPYLNYHIASIEDIFDNITSLSQFIFTFDCKLHTNDQEQSKYKKTFCDAVTRTLEKYHITENVFIESQDEEFLEILKGINPKQKLFIYANSFTSGFDTALELDLYGITISTEKISKEEIKKAQNHDLFISIFGTNSEKSNREAINKNPDAIQTDHLRSLLKLLK